MADAPAGSSHRFERDLRAIREARGVPLPEVQQETRIPADVLDRFEMGRLVGDPHYNEVYLKSLLKAYASAVGLPPHEVVAAYEAEKGGTYGGELQKHLGAARPPEPLLGVADEPAPTEPHAEQEPDHEKEPEPEPEPPRPATAAPPAVAALRRAGTPDAPAGPTLKQETKARVRSRETVTSSTSGIESSWALIIGGTLIALLVIGGVLWLLIRPEAPDTVEPVDPIVAVPEEEQDDLEEDPDALAPPGDAPQLRVPIQVTVIAQDGALGGGDGFRVTEAPDVRRPYWLEQGESQTFSSDSMVVIWGHETGGTFGIPEAAQVRLQDYTWNPEAGSVLRIDRQRGQALLDSLHRVQARPGS